VKTPYGPDFFRNYINKLDEVAVAPLIIAAGAAWTAYDAWKMKQAYDRGEISGEDLAKAVGTDIAATIAGGAVAKVAGKGWKYGKKIYNSRKEAQNAAMQSAADKVNTRIPLDQAGPRITKGWPSQTKYADRIEPTISPPGSVVDKNFDRNQKLSSYADTGRPDPVLKKPN
jgi:hypothetical protein